MRRIELRTDGFRPDSHWNTCVRLIEPEDELPLPTSIENLYLDFETTSLDAEVPSINPHRKCRILGVAVLFDDEPEPYYVPVRHYYLDDNDDLDSIKWRSGNYRSVQEVEAWLRTLLTTAKKWINHNIKYDYHVAFNDAKIVATARLIDTLVLCKLGPYEERFTYGLTPMMKMHGIDIEPYEKEIHRCLGKVDKDYGLIPIEPMAPYAAVDTLCVRYLYNKLRKDISRDCDRVVQLELDLTPMLLAMEQTGLKVNHERMIADSHKLIARQPEIVRELKEITGFSDLNFESRNGKKEFFIDHLGWSVDLTDTGEDSFGKQSIKKYSATHPQIVDRWFEYQAADKVLNGFYLPYLTVHMDSHGLMHGDFNQLVRTGRMSCRNPNLQQLPKYVKECICPFDDDYVLVEFDLSQIEFRVIVHYLGNQRCIQAFRDDPTTDFHSWVAKMCNIPRDPAKAINFMLGYGGGKGKCVEMLAARKEIRAELSSDSAIQQRALDVFNTYHAALPELKPTSKRATAVAYSRGYVRTLLGRQRHLNPQFAFKAFNSVCQGSAADIQKDITLRLRPFLGLDCLMHALVHDSWLFSIKKNRVEELVPLIKAEIERPIEGIDFSVPLKSDFGSGQTWRDCDA